MVDVATTSRRSTWNDSERPRVVLVEDDTRARRALQRDLSRAGFAVMCADDGASACDLFASHGADVIVTDLRMPRMDGLELTLRLGTAHPQLPIIAMTGASAPDARLLSALERGAVSVLAKPFAVDDLVAAIRRALRGPTTSASTDVAWLGDEGHTTGPAGRQRPGDHDARPDDERPGDPTADGTVNR